MRGSAEWSWRSVWSMSKFALFCRVPSLDEPPVSAPTESAVEYCTPWGALRLALKATLPQESRNLFLAVALLRPFGFRVLTITHGPLVVHYSFMLPWLGRIPGMRLRDLEIGPCWTRDEYRRAGLFQFALKKICRDLAREGRAFWMAARADNAASVKGIRSSKFRHVANCEQVPWTRVMLHRYRVEGGLAHALDPADWRDNEEEKVRYNTAARSTLRRRIHPWQSSIQVHFREPFESYHQLIDAIVAEKTAVLDVCCGDGLHTLPIAMRSRRVVGLDIAEQSLSIARREARSAGAPFAVVVGESGLLPFMDQAFDVVTSAGGLSYMPAATFINEVIRVLRPDGSAVFVDSFDENPLYRLNRWKHWLTGTRSKNTLSRIPSQRTVEMFRRHFRSVEVYYFGLLSFLGPVLIPLIGDRRFGAFLTRTDRRFQSFSRLAFKIVIVAQVPAAGKRLPLRREVTSNVEVGSAGGGAVRRSCESLSPS